MLDYKKITDQLSLPLFENFKRIYYQMTEIDVVLEKINDPCEQNFDFKVRTNKAPFLKEGPL